MLFLSFMCEGEWLIA